MVYFVAKSGPVLVAEIGPFYVAKGGPFLVAKIGILYLTIYTQQFAEQANCVLFLYGSFSPL